MTILVPRGNAVVRKKRVHLCEPTIHDGSEKRRNLGKITSVAGVVCVAFTFYIMVRKS